MVDNDNKSEFLESLESAFNACDRDLFETILYKQVKTYALTTCQPKVATAEEASASLSKSTNETSSDAELQEYNVLLKSIFADFECFLSHSQCESKQNPIQDSVGNHLERLATNLAAVCPKVRTPCGRIFKELEPTFRCKDCSTDTTCAFCRSCFFASIHADHKYKMHTSSGGYCDCGDEEAWTSGAWCRIHGGNEDVDEEEKQDVYRTVEEEQRLEIERLQSRLDKLPDDLISRATFLLQPLINSCAFVLFELLQGTPQTFYSPLSKLDMHDEEEKEDMGSTEAVENWPPPISHLPSTSAREDADNLGVAGWPHTAPNKRNAYAMRTRCRAQQARLKRLHPVLYELTHCTDEDKHFTVVLYNNEYHNYEDVIKVIRRMDRCTSQQATLFAILVNRDGRTPLMTGINLETACERSTHISDPSAYRVPMPPLRGAAVDANIYAIEVFFICLLRWLERLASGVVNLRPFICNAIIGRFTTTSAISNNLLSSGEMMLPDSLLAHILDRFHLSHRGVRKTVSRLIAAVLLQEPYHRRIFSIEFTRHYDTITHAFVYDDHLDADSICSLTCQVYTVSSLARQLLQQNNVLLRLINRMVQIIEKNSIALPPFYEPSTSLSASSTSSLKMESLFATGQTFSNFPSHLKSSLTVRRSANQEDWVKASKYLCTTDGGYEGRFPALTFHWHHVQADRPEFHPFERQFRVFNDTRFILTSLLNVKPLAGESTDCPDGWWGDDSARENFIAYFCKFLELLGFLQDMNGMQRAVQSHVENEQEWISTIKMSSHLLQVINFTVQVASSSREVLLEAIRETRVAFEERIGTLDRCFRVDPSSLVAFQSLGVIAEVYDYDVAFFRVSVMQPLPRLLAALFGHALEMGLRPNEIGLEDHGFANLVIERPLQTITFYAQCSANLWVRNGLVVHNIIQTMFNGLRIEMVDRNYQLVQQAAAVIPSDELIIRLVHKLNLKEYLSTETMQAKAGRVQSMEALLRTLLYLVSHRSREGVGYFDPSVVSLSPSNPSLFPQKLNEIDESIEVNYGQLIEDVVHALCTKPMTHSELLSALPLQPSGCLLRRPPPYQTPGDTTLLTTNWRGSRKDAIERPLQRILQQIATPAIIGTKQVFTLRPEVILSRFNRFYPGYRHSDQTLAEEWTSRTLKKWMQDSPLAKIDFPVPPPPPRPRRRFFDSLPLLQLVRSATFVRLLRRLLDIALNHGYLQSWWSDTLLELVLHLIIIALYEDAITFVETGERPFINVASRISKKSETDEELANIALTQHFTDKPCPLTVSTTDGNCIVDRLKILLEKQQNEQNLDLIRWTLKLWNEVAQTKQSAGSSIAANMDMDTSEYPSSEKQRKLEAKRQRQAKIMDKMSNMQRKFMDSHLKYADTMPMDEGSDGTTMLSVLDKGQSGELSASSHAYSIAALGPHASEARLAALTKEAYTITCILCLEEVEENDKHKMVAAAFACRSCVLSSPLPLCGQTMNFDKKQSHYLQHSSDDNKSIDVDSSSIHNTHLSADDTRLAEIATSAVAASVGSGEDALVQLPRLVAGLASAFDLERPSTSSDLPEKTSNKESAECLDPWFPRPLVASRSPIGEEGTFIAFCPHLMHASCKEKYASQLKSRNEQILRRAIDRSPAFEFRCSVCKSLSNFDLPLYGRLQDSVPCDWIQQRLSKEKFDLATWLRRIQRWLDERPTNSPVVSLTQSEVPDCLKLLLELLQTTPEAGDENRVALKTLLCDIYLRAEITFAVGSEEMPSPSPSSPSSSSNTNSHRSFAMMLRARSLFRNCFGLTEAGNRQEPSDSDRWLSTPVLNALPTHPLRVSTSLRVFVQRIALLSQPQSVPRRTRTHVAGATISFEGLPNEELMFHIMTTNLNQSDIEDSEEDDMADIAPDGEGPIQIIELASPGLQNSDYEDDVDNEDEVMSTPVLVPHTPPRHPPTSPSKATKRGNNNSRPLPPSLNEAAQELHTSLMSVYSRIFFISEVLVNPTASSADADLAVEKTEEEQFSAAVSHLKAAFTCCRRRGLRAIQSAACEWRALRHSVAYTLVIWERYLRQLGPDTHFFNGELAERHKIGLGYLMRASLQAHVKLAPVSRGCGVDECLGQQHPACWPQRRDDPQWWWWHAYFAPAPDGSTEDKHCCYKSQCLVQNLVESVTRIAVSGDAARLWRLLLPDSNALSPSPSIEELEETPLIVGPSATMNEEASPESHNLPMSLLWEADMTFLFVNLMFLRPGLESCTSSKCGSSACQGVASLSKRQQQLADNVKEREGETTLGDEFLICSCNEGHPRLPIGDSHEFFTLRLCYVGLLVQVLLSWQPNLTCVTESPIIVQDAHTMLWTNEKLLIVRRRLQHLSGLPVGQETPSSQLLMQLYQHIRSHVIPFLRIAAFVVREITDLEVPAALLNRINSSTYDLTPVNEFSLLLSYLGLPIGPTDLCVVLSSSEGEQIVDRETNVKAAMAEEQLSSSLWMARLITSWCLVGRKSASRRLFARLQTLYASSSSAILLPEPSVRVPNLIQLPKQYVTLLAMAIELKGVHSGSNIHSDPSLCLVCGAVACFTCYSCRTFEPVDDSFSGGGGGGTMTSVEDAQLHRMGHDCVVYDIQVHARRYHAGYAPIILLYTGRLLILSEQARRTTELTAPYRDEFGETDTGLRRGNPLFLDEVAYRNLNEMWLNHQITSSTMSNLYLA